MNDISVTYVTDCYSGVYEFPVPHKPGVSAEPGCNISAGLLPEACEPLWIFQRFNHLVCDLIRSKKSTNKPFLPSCTTSSTGRALEPMTRHPVAIASSMDQERTKG